MRMRITNSCGSTVLHFDDVDGKRRRRAFWVSGGGYVRERVGADLARDPQVCDGLARNGSTLTCENPANLPAIIRREYYAMKRKLNLEAI